MLFRDLAQLGQIPLGWRDAAGRARDRFDDDGRDRRCIVQADNARQFLERLVAPFRFALCEGLFCLVVGGRDVVDALQHVAEGLAVVHHAAHRDAAEPDAAVAAFAADEARAAAFAAGLVIGKRDLECRIDGFRAGIGEERVVEVARRHQGKLGRQLEHLGVGILEGRRKIELSGHLLDGLGYFVAPVAGIDAKQTRRGIQHLAAIRGVKMHILGAGEQTRLFLEAAVRRERKPIGFKLIGLHIKRGHRILRGD